MPSNFFVATRWIKNSLPGCQGIRRCFLRSRFLFRGNDSVGEAMYAVLLLCHGIKTGLDTAICQCRYSDRL